MNPHTGAVYVMASSPTYDPNLIDQPGELREGAEDPRRLRRRLRAAEPRDERPLHAGLDVQDRHRRGRARHRRVHAGVDVRRPRLLHGVRPEGLERGQPGPERAGGVRARDPRAGLPALDQLGLLQRRQADRREDDPRLREALRLLQDAAARDARRRALAERPLQEHQDGPRARRPEGPELGRPGPARLRPDDDARDAAADGDGRRDGRERRRRAEAVRRPEDRRPDGSTVRTRSRATSAARSSRRPPPS